MRKSKLLLFALSMLIGTGLASAKTVQKEVTLTFANNPTYGITWNANDCTVDGFKVTFTSGSTKKPFWTFSNSINLTGMAFTVTERTAETTFELVDESNNTAYYHWFGTDSGTKNDLANISSADKGSCDLTKIVKINLDPRTSATDKYITFSNITLTIEYNDGYDEVISLPATDATLFPLTAEGVKTDFWGTNTYDAATKTMTIAGNGNAIGWDFGSAKNLSSYNKLVIELQEAMDFTPQVRFRNATVKGTGKDVHYIGVSKGPTIKIDLTAAQFEYDDRGENAKVSLDLTDINAIYFWAWADGEKKIKLSTVYLVSATGEVTYLVRNNTAANAYGTISLPFAALTPSNAAVYEVLGIGVNAIDEPQTLYLKTATEMEAGKAYVFKSSDAEDITFTKTGSADDLAEALTGQVLQGTFTATKAPQNSYILVGTQWKKVTKANTNTVGAYRAWLDITNADRITEAQARAAISFDLVGGGETTGVNEKFFAEQSGRAERRMKNEESAAAVYNLSGQRVGADYKGVVIKNGRKFIIK